MKKVIFLLLLAAAGGYWLLLTKPGLYYNKTMDYRNFTVNARGALPEKVEPVLDKVYDKISVSEFFSQDKKFNIYLAGGHGEFLFFTPFLHGDYARLNPLKGYIFIAAADFDKDEARAAPGAAAHRDLDVEITRAAAREMARGVVEPLSFLLMDEWKLQGFSERLSGGTGEYQPPDICKSEDPAMLDFKYGMAVDYAIKVDGLTMTELLRKDYKYENVRDAVKKQNCGG